MLYIIAFVILLCFLIIFILCIYYINKIKQRQRKVILTIKKYFKLLNYAIRKNNIKATDEIEFANKIQYNNKQINLGKLIIDYENQKILICETMIYDKYFVCLPDIHTITYKELTECNIVYKKNIISNKEFLKIVNDKKMLKISKYNIALKINANVKDYFPRYLDYKILGNFDILLQIYRKLNSIIYHK